MDAAIQSNNFLLSFNNAQHSLHEQLARMYSDLQSRHKAQKIEMIEYKSRANYWEAQFTQLKTRENELINENEELKAKLCCGIKMTTQQPRYRVADKVRR